METKHLGKGSIGILMVTLNVYWRSFDVGRLNHFVSRDRCKVLRSACLCNCLSASISQTCPNFTKFLANVNSRSRSLYAIARPSVVCLSSVCLSVVCLSVCNVRLPYSGGSDFRQYFYGIRYLGHPWTSKRTFSHFLVLFSAFTLLVG